MQKWRMGVIKYSVFSFQHRLFQGNLLSFENESELQQFLLLDSGYCLIILL